MARTARIVVPNFPHHITQRGNRRQEVFFEDKDYEEYLRLLEKHAYKFDLDILLYSLIPNHVHVIATPKEEKSLSLAMGWTHQKYTNKINSRYNWRGYLWQGRFSSYVLDEPYLIAAARYILLNPVRAGLVKRPQDYKWSSIRHHLKLENISFIKDKLLQDVINDWNALLGQGNSDKDVKLFKLHERTGRPLGSESFLNKLEAMLNKGLKKKKTGPKPKGKQEN